MGFGESLLTGMFVMSIVFAILIVLWGIVGLFSKVVMMIDGGEKK